MNDVNLGWRAVTVAERTTISSSTPFLSGGKRELNARSAFADSGLPVTCPFVVRFPGSSKTASTSPTTIAPIQAPIVRHGWRLDARANRSVTPMRSVSRFTRSHRQ